MSRPSPLAALVLAAALSLAAGGCVQPRAAIPGDTEYEVTGIEIAGAEEVSTGPLETGGLSLRPAGLTAPPQPFNPYRVEEDRGRLYAFWQNQGFFDIAVEGPELTFDHEAKTVEVRWQVTEGPRYTIGSVDVADAPDGYREALLDTLPFGPGDDVVMEDYRRHRFAMSDVLLDDGWLHATIYSRTWVDRDKKQVHWVYFVDEGPRTRIGSIEVLGAGDDVPAEAILERSGLEVGQPVSARDLRKAELDLLDTGSFHHANVVSDADVPERVRPLPPETGGILGPERIDAQGNLVPRTLSEDLALSVVVAEAPSVQARAGGGAQADLTRFDALARGELWLRDVFGPYHQIVLEGRVGYGLLYGDLSDEPLGLYGSALVRYVKAGLFGRIGDFRLTAEFDDRLFPGYHTREVMGGPGLRIAFTEHLFFDLDIYARYGFESEGYGPFDPEVAATLELVDGAESYLDSELRTSLVWDVRNHRLEPTEGWFGALSLAVAPGDPLGAHRYLSSELDARWYVPLDYALSLAFRALGGWVFALDDEAGVPPTARLFGGGNYGMRGFGRQQLSSYAETCDADGSDCEAIPVGGLSTVQGTVELRWLPFRQLYGAAVFADVGSMGDGLNPFADGVNLALGTGVRIRVFWYFSLALDFSYRVLDDSRFEQLDVDSFQFFGRIGEAF